MLQFHMAFEDATRFPLQLPWTDADQFTGAPSAMALCIAVGRSVPHTTTGSSAQHSAEPLPAHTAPR